MTRRALAIELSKINWIKIQADDDRENERLLELKSLLKKIKKKEDVTDLLLRVLEARVLELSYPGEDTPFNGMLNFEFIKNGDKEIK